LETRDNKLATIIQDFSHLEGGLGRPASQLDKKSQPSWAIFYNAYIPQNGTGRVNALRVIAEQMGQIGNSTVLKNNQEANVTLYYNTIGSTSFHIQEMNAICAHQAPGLDCRHMQHYEKADEMVTLFELRNFLC
jgi:Tfp pilus tip-associated adhesin PilY1